MIRRAGRSWLEAAYAALLLCFPSAFRTRFGDGMRTAFREGVAARRGTARLNFVCRACVGAIAAGLAERVAARRRTDKRSPAGARSGSGAIDWMRQFGRDLRLGARMLRRRPVAAMFSIATLTIGISATAIVFSLVDAALLKALNLPAPDRLVALTTAAHGETGMSAHDDVQDWIARASSFSAVAALRAQTVNVTGLDTPATVRGGFVLGDFFGVAGVLPAQGRPLVPADHAAGAPPVVVISHDVWQLRFVGTADILGRTVLLNNLPFTVVGVMPPGFEFPYDGMDVWMPIRFHTGTLSRGARILVPFARLRDGATVEAAAAEMTTIAADLAARYPATNRDRTVRVERLQTWLTTDVRSHLTLLGALVLVLLAAACANVAGLQIGAAAQRRDELGIRLALGASRGRIIRQVLAEHLALGAVAGLLAVLTVRVIVPLVVQTALEVPALNLFGIDRVTVDTRVMMCALLVTLTAALGSGLVPAWQWARQAPRASLRSPSRTVGDRRLARTRMLLVTAQVAIAAVLVTSGALIVTSYVRVVRIDPGFDARGVWSLEYRLPPNKYRDDRARTSFHDRVVDEVARIPGVAAAAVARGLPLSGNGDIVEVLADDAAPGTPPLTAGANTVSDRFFEALSIPVVEGRTFDRSDVAGAPLVAVIGQSLARRLWPNGSAVGRTIIGHDSPVRARVIGVVGDIRQFDLSDAPLPMAYLRNAQNAGIFMTVVARVEGAPPSVAPALQRAVWTVDRDQPVWKVRPLGALVESETSGTRFMLAALAVFAVSAMLLVATGLYGIVSQGVSERVREFGVRMALGANRRSVLQTVLTAGLRLTVLGLVPGLAGSLLVTRWLSTVLYGASPTAAVPHLASAAVIAGIAMIASWLPARRAAAIDPASALRQ